MDLGAEVTRETFHSSLEMGRQVMQALGVDEARAARDVARFREHDEQLLREQLVFYDDEAALVASAKEARRALAELFDADREAERDADRDAGGDAAPPRAD
jgi:glutathione-regulated potassium-efflux system protein KefB